MGELLSFYHYSDYAFVGGSLVPIGGHNVLEPIKMQLPVFCGPFMQNSQSICDELLKHKALQVCASAAEFAERLISIHHNPAQLAQQIEAASAVLQMHGGAVGRYWDKIADLLSHPGLSA
jgi:3-deoxy-D-manno-octulosonic-acid transferase